jgi:hypothetical protein
VPTDVGPHAFKALRWRDARWFGGRCAHCYLPRDAHPVTGWTTARPLGDRREATALATVVTPLPDGSNPHA